MLHSTIDILLLINSICLGHVRAISFINFKADVIKQIRKGINTKKSVREKQIFQSETICMIKNIQYFDITNIFILNQLT